MEWMFTKLIIDEPNRILTKSLLSMERVKLLLAVSLLIELLKILSFEVWAFC